MEKLPLENLEVYQIACNLSDSGWSIYSSLNWEIKRIIGEQFITATDSVGANIAEGYGRYHFLDRIKFFYNARASLIESIHWNHLLNKRQITTGQIHDNFNQIATTLKVKLNNLISSTYRQKYN